MEAKTIKINWAAILAFSTFWTYAFYASSSYWNFIEPGTARTMNNATWFSLIGSSLVVGSIFVFFLMKYFRKDSFFKDEIGYTSEDKKVILIYLVSMIVLSYPELNNNVMGDSAIYSRDALMHSIQTTYLLAKLFPFVESLEFRNVIYVINLLLLVASCIFIYFFNKLPIWVKVVFYSLLFLILRVTVAYLSKDFNNAHPPLRLFPVWLSTSILYPTNVSLRFPQLIGLIVLMFISFKFASRYFSNNRALLFGFVVGTIPVLWHVGLMVDFCIWGTLCVTYLLYCLVNKALDKDYSFNLLRLSSIVSIGILLRESNVVCIILLLAIFVYSYYCENKSALKKLLLLSPIVIAILFVLKTVITGSTVVDPASLQNSLVSKILFSITSKISLYAAINGALYWLVFVPFIALIYKKNKVICAFFFAFLLVDYIQFYSITTWLWGFGKYQAEYVIPFAIIGFFLFLYFFIKRKYLYLLVITVLSCFNIYTFKNLSNWNKSFNSLGEFASDTKKLFGQIILTDFFFPDREALVTAKRMGYSKKVYLFALGSNHIVLPILAGYTVKEVSLIFRHLEVPKKIQDEDNKNLADKLNENKNIKLVFFSFYADPYIISYLKNNGWSNWRNFYDEKNKSSIIGLIRK